MYLIDLGVIMSVVFPTLYIARVWSEARLHRSHLCFVCVCVVEQPRRKGKGKSSDERATISDSLAAAYMEKLSNSFVNFHLMHF